MSTRKVNAVLNRLVELKRSGWINRRVFIMQKWGRLTEALRIRPHARKSYPFKPVAAGLLVFMAVALWGFLLSKPAKVRPGTAAVEATPSSAREVPPGAGENPSRRRDAEAQAAGARFAERLFWRGGLFSELSRQLWAESYPTVYREVQGDPEYAARFVEAARAEESELIRLTLGDPPLIVGGANGPVLSAQVSGPVGRAIRQGLRQPSSYRHDAQDQSRPRPYYHQNRWCWKVDRFWYRSRNTFGLDVKDCVAAVVAKDDPYHEYKVLTLDEAVF